jgi:hypothetical protein
MMLSLMAAAAAAPAQSRPTSMDEFVRRNDEAVETYLERQNTDPTSRWCGALADATGLHEPGSASGILARGVASYVHPDSKYSKSPVLRKRLELAIEHMERVQTPDGNFDLLITNFNSPPDTAFITRNLCSAAFVARQEGAEEIFDRMTPLLKRCGEGLWPVRRCPSCTTCSRLRPTRIAWKSG